MTRKQRTEKPAEAPAEKAEPMSLHATKPTHNISEHEVRTHSPGNDYLVGIVDGRLVATSKILSITETRAETTRAIYLLKGKNK